MFAGQIGTRGKPRTRTSLRGANSTRGNTRGGSESKRVHFSPQDGTTPPPRVTSRGASAQEGSRTPSSQAVRGRNALSKTFGAKNNSGSNAPPAQSTFGTKGSSGSSAGQGAFQARYQVLKKDRDWERSEAIAKGFLADPDKPRTLAEAITPVGTCPDMCAEFERVERVVQNDVWAAELDPEASSKDTPDEARMVKKFRRAAAGVEEQLPSDLRPPHVLQKTLDYLFNDLIGNSTSLSSVHHFVWDRTRAVRNDFSIQQISKIPELRVTINSYERIARFHIVSLHQLAQPEKPYDKYDSQQEREQLDKTLLSLMQLYDDSRGRLQSPNEAEFRAYCIIFQIQDPVPDLEDRVQTWPRHIVKDERVQRALKLYAFACNIADIQGPLKPRASHPIAQANWKRFWSLVESNEISYTMACVAEIYFNLVRRTALNAIWQAFRSGGKNATQDWTTSELMGVLGFETEEEVESFATAFGFVFEEGAAGALYIDLNSVQGRILLGAVAGSQKQISSQLVERKRHYRSLPALINGMSVKAANEAGLVEKTPEMDVMQDADQQDDNSMFVRQDDVRKFGAPQVTNKGISGTTTEANFSATTNATANVKLDPFANSFAPSQSSSMSLHLGNLASTQPGFGAQNPSLNETANENANKTPTLAHTPQFGESSSTTSSFGTFWSSASLAPSTPTLPSFSFTKVPAPSTQSPAEFGSFSPGFGSFSRSSSSAPTFGFTPMTQHLPSSDASQFPRSDATTPSTTVEQQPSIAEKASARQKPSTSPIFFGSNLEQQQIFPTPSTIPQSPSQQNHPFNFTSSSTGKSSTKLPTPFFSFQSPTDSPPMTPKRSLDNHHSPNVGGPATQVLSITKLAPPSQIPSQLCQPTTETAQSPPPSFFPPYKPSTLSPSSTSAAERRKQDEESVYILSARKERAAAVLDKVARTLVEEPYGLFEQFIEFMATPMIRAAKEKVEAERLRHEADEFRLRTLSHRYGKRWREVCWNRRLFRQGKERRRRLERELSAREQRSRQSSILSQLDVFRESANRSRSPSMNSVQMTIETQAQPIGHPSSDYQATANEISSTPSNSPPLSRSAPQQQTGRVYEESVQSRSRQSFLQSLHSTLSNPATPSRSRQSFTTSEQMQTGVAPLLPSNTRNDTTRSTYFRLKAMGLDPTSSTLFSSTRDHTRKRPSSVEFERPAIPNKKALTTKRAHNELLVDAKPVTKAPTAEDEDIFAAVRQVREAMSASMTFFKEEVSKDELSKSQSDATPLAQSRISRISTSAFGRSLLSNGFGNSVQSTIKSPAKPPPPKYRSRVSKFLPRQRYADVLMQQHKTITGSRSWPRHRPSASLTKAIAAAAVNEQDRRSLQSQTNHGFGRVEIQGGDDSTREPTVEVERFCDPRLLEAEPSRLINGRSNHQLENDPGEEAEESIKEESSYSNDDEEEGVHEEGFDEEGFEEEGFEEEALEEGRLEDETRQDGPLHDEEEEEFEEEDEGSEEDDDDDDDDDDEEDDEGDMRGSPPSTWGGKAGTSVEDAIEL